MSKQAATTTSAAAAMKGSSAGGAGRVTHRTRIKICGITSVDAAKVAVDAGADCIGLMFVNTSPRFVLPGPAQAIARSLPPLFNAIAVFQNPSDPDLQNWRGQWVQLHGQEDEFQIARVAKSRRVIKAMPFEVNHITRWNQCPDVSAMLIDGSEGGLGTAFDHKQLAELMPRISKPVILAGGLTPQNVGKAIRTVKPYGVDVSSGVESKRGEKDAGLIRAFCEAVRAADADVYREESRVPPRE